MALMLVFIVGIWQWDNSTRAASKKFPGLPCNSFQAQPFAPSLGGYPDEVSVQEIIRHESEYKALKHKLSEKNIEVVDENSLTPLFLAADLGNINAAKVLIEMGANVNKSIQDIGTPFAFALISGKYAMACLLLNSGTKLPSTEPNMGALMALTILGIKPEKQADANVFLEYFVNNGFDPNVVVEPSSSPLMMAILFDLDETVKMLLGKGARMDLVVDGKSPGHPKRTAWDLAKEKGNPVIMQLLREAAIKQGFKEPPSASTLEKPAAQPPSTPAPAPLRKKRELEPA